LDDIKQHILDNIPTELQEKMFLPSMDIDSFVNYVYFDLYAAWFSSNSEKRALNKYTTAFLDQCTKELLADPEHFHNIVAEKYVGSGLTEDDEIDDLHDKHSLNKQLQRSIADMLLTDPISKLYEYEDQVHGSSVNHDLRKKVQNIHQGERYDFSVSVLYYYEVLSEIYLDNEKGAKLRSFSNPQKSAKKIETVYKNVACFIRDVLLKSNNFGDLVDSDDDLAARAITLSHMDDHAKMYSSFLLSQMLQRLVSESQLDRLVDEMVSLLLGRYTPEEFIHYYSSPEIQCFLSNVVYYLQKPTLNSSSPILVFPVFLEKMNILYEDGSDVSHIPVLFFTWKLLMEYFKKDIKEHVLILEYDPALFSLFISAKYDIFEHYRRFVDYFSVETGEARIPKPLAKIFRIVSKEIIHPDFEKKSKN